MAYHAYCFHNGSGYPKDYRTTREVDDTRGNRNRTAEWRRGKRIYRAPRHIGDEDTVNKEVQKRCERRAH
jgi:hypothetical protein